jgi:hypothetical protein
MIVSDIFPAFILKSMSTNKITWMVAVLLILVALAAGCTTPQNTGPVSEAPPTGTSSATTYTAPLTTVAKTADVDTMVNVRFNDMACLDVQKELGKEYLYPDQKFRLSVSPPINSRANVNVVFVDENDSLAFRQTKPAWESVKKVWVYEGIVPLVQFNDITVPVEKSFTIKTQSKYYICVDDRKETGVNDVMLQVPVKLLRT